MKRLVPYVPLIMCLLLTPLGCGSDAGERSSTAGEQARTIEETSQVTFSLRSHSQVVQEQTLSQHPQAPLFAINSTNATSCGFTYDATSNSTGIEIESDAINCSTPNKCIVCTTTANGNDCAITCDGTVPSNQATEDDYFDVILTMTSVLTTDASTPDGAILIHGDVDDWPQFQPDGLSGGGPDAYHIAYDLSACDGSGNPAMMNVSELDPGANKFENNITQTWQNLYQMDTLGDGSCTIVQTLKAKMEFAGANAPGVQIYLTGDANPVSSIIIQTTICDDDSSCAYVP